MTRTKSLIRTKAGIQATFGPSLHNAWALTDQCLSLVRKVKTPVTVRFDAQPQALEIDLARSALTVTDRCVFSSAPDASLLGYDCVLLSDAYGTPSSADGIKAVHFMVKQLHFFVATISTLLPALAELTVARRMGKQRGTTVSTTTNLKDAK